MRIASFNVNSIRAHLPNMLTWLKNEQPDIVLLQELKCMDNQFPYEVIEALGYNCAVHGQKSWNGVAILSKFPIEETVKNMPTFPNDIHSRYIECYTGGVRVAGLYLPNGNPVPSEKFDYKLKWMNALNTHARRIFNYDEPVIIGGDFNVIPTDKDVYSPESFRKDAVMQPETRAAFFELEKQGWQDALKKIKGEDAIYYTYWDYRRGARQNNNGILLDFFMLNKPAQELLIDGGIHDEPRDDEKPSDHTPIWIKLNK